MEHVSRWQTRDREAIILVPILWRDVDMLNTHFCKIRNIETFFFCDCNKTEIYVEDILDIERFVYMEEFFQL